MIQKVYKRGFTLIELLVVIAIIGILAGIVLASLGTARSGAQDAAVKEQLSGLRSSAEIFYGSNGNAYGPANGAQTGLCTAAAGGSTMWTSATGNISGIISSTIGITTAEDCGTSGTAWAVAVLLPSGTAAAGPYWCVDSTGVSKSMTKLISSTSCK